MQAINHNHLDILKLLIEKNANIEAIDTDVYYMLFISHGWTPLILASREGNGEIVKCLLNSGANIETRDDERMNQNSFEINGRNPLFFAILRGYIDIVKYLVAKGANIEAKMNNWIIFHIIFMV